MTVVKAQQDFLTHERHCTQRACNHGIGTKSSNRVWFKRCKYRSDSPKPWMCSTAASTAQLSTTYASGIASDLSLSPVEELADISDAP